MFRAAHPSLRCVLSGRRFTQHRSMVNIRQNSNSSVECGSFQLDIRTVEYDDVKRRTREFATHIHLIDVREPHEVEQGFIPSAKNIPLGVLRDSLHLEPDVFKEKVGHDKPHELHEIVFYCRSGKRAAAACEVALKHGYKNVMNYLGSWQDWAHREK